MLGYFGRLTESVGHGGECAAAVIGEFGLWGVVEQKFTV
jgi:hypothetical protein